MNIHIRRASFRIESTARDAIERSAPEIIRLCAEGSVRTDGEGAVVFRYIEHTEPAEGRDVICTLTCFSDGCVRVLREGGVNTELFFERGAAHRSVYSAGGCSFDALTETRSTELKRDEEGGELLLDYRLTVGGVERDCRFRLRYRVL